MPGSEADRTEKRARLQAVREAAGADALLLTSHEAVSWYLEGVRSHVSLAGPPVAAVRVDAAGDTLFVADNEADRLIAEELLPSDAARVVRVPWLTPPADAAAAAGTAVAEASVAPALRAARASLLPAERDRYRALGRDAAAAMTDAAADARSEHSERAIAADLGAPARRAGHRPPRDPRRGGVPARPPPSSADGCRARPPRDARRLRASARAHRERDPLGRGIRVPVKTRSCG